MSAAFSGAAAAPFSAPLAGSLFAGLGGTLFALGRGRPFLAFFLLFLDHLNVTRGHGLGGGGRRRFFLFRARHRHRDGGDVFITQDFDAGGRLDFTKVNGFAQFEMADVHGDLLRQILGQTADLEFEQNVFEHATAGFHASRFPGSFQRDVDDDFFVFGDFMEIHVQHVAFERVMLDFLHEREAFGARIAFNGQVHQHVFRGRMVDEFLKFLRVDLEVLRFGLATINDRGHAPGGAQSFGSAPARQRAGIRFQRH